MGSRSTRIRPGSARTVATIAARFSLVSVTPDASGARRPGELPERRPELALRLLVLKSTRHQFAQLVGDIVDQYPFARTIHLVMDNLNIHCGKSLVDYYGEQEGGYLWNRLTVHYTPKHGSWLNQAEIELSLFSRQCLGKRRIPDLETLQRETQAWNRLANQEQTKINWRFTATEGQKTLPL